MVEGRNGGILLDCFSGSSAPLDTCDLTKVLKGILLLGMDTMLPFHAQAHTSNRHVGVPDWTTRQKLKSPLPRDGHPHERSCGAVRATAALEPFGGQDSSSAT